MTKTLLPAIASEILARRSEGRTVSTVKVAVGEDGAFAYAIE